MSMRLDKFLAEVGEGTRSEVKRLIKAKFVTINGLPAVKPEQKVDEIKDEICLRGRLLAYDAFSYYLLHKPAGCVSATEDALHPTVMDYLKGITRKDLFPVGRLDIDTEGLLLITNDGLLAHNLLSPTKHIPKTYYAKVHGRVTEKEISLFEQGIDIGDEKLTKPAKLVVLESGEISEITLTITEGRFHQVKRMFGAVGKEVLYLKRTAMGALTLPGDLPTGMYRELTEAELAILKKASKSVS